MPSHRFFHPGFLRDGESLTLEGEEAHHLLVTRIREGESVEVINGNHLLAQALVKKIGKREVALEIVSVERGDPPVEIILAQALSRGSKLDLIVEKGVELGCTRFLLFPGEKSEKREAHLARLEKIVIAAMKQCGRLDLPNLITMPPLMEWKEILPNSYYGEVDEAPLFSEVWKKGPTCFFVGPESGFSERERLFLQEHNVRGVRLSPYILRTETAPLVALSLLSHWLI